MDFKLNPPASVVEKNGDAMGQLAETFAAGRVKLSKTKIEKMERELTRIIDRWKEGTSTLRTRLREDNDLMEGVSEEVDFPWSGASSVSMGTARGMARTLAATMDRALFSVERPFVAKKRRGSKKLKANDIEDATNWLSSEENNLLDTLRDTPIPLYRDGTIPIMGEWVREIEKAVDYKSYDAVVDFEADYPDAEAAGMSQSQYAKIKKQLNEGYDPDVMIEYVYDEVTYDAPRFSMIPLARFVFYPLSAPEMRDLVVYGMQFFEGEEKAKAKARWGEYDEEPTQEALSAVKGEVDDIWGYDREAIEGISSSGDDYKRLECYKLVLKKDLDGDDIPEKYLVVYEHSSGRILRIRRYGLRKNIDCVVLARFLKRDGRLLGPSLCRDGHDKFKMIDDFHRHRQNVRAITDNPMFLVPDKLKDDIDFGSEDFQARPGLTFWVPDEYMDPTKAPRQIAVQNLDNTQNSLDEEGGVMRYLEIDIGISQGMSGKETLNDPQAPATKTLALLRQATFRIDAYIAEFRRAIPLLLKLHNALYYQYGPKKVKYMGKTAGQDIEMEIDRALFGEDALDFGLKATELALSPEYQMEKSMAIIQAAGASPMITQMKPDIIIHAWNEFILSTRCDDPKRFLIESPGPMAGLGAPPGSGAPGMPGTQGMPAMPGGDNPFGGMEEAIAGMLGGAGANKSNGRASKR